MHPILAAATTAAHHVTAGQHDARYWLTGIVVALTFGLIMAVITRSA